MTAKLHGPMESHVGVEGQLAICSRLDGCPGGVALTFDDCDDGAAWTRILDVLASEAVPAAFFGLGMRVEQFRLPARRTVSEGHVVGAHGWDHADFTRMSRQEVIWRLVADRAAWRRAGATDVAVFRPPFGRYDKSTVDAAIRAGYARMVLWDVDPRDWELPGPSVIVDRVLAACSAGSVVDLHVTAQTATALPGLIAGVHRRGLACVRLDTP
ncbi:MAG TPA: polysaccharide deacetylase family protein [Acidimicrobiales bacterium]|nr:polysaccharide deacetylase family protein [Acidimicrobiales bacterium]